MDTTHGSREIIWHTDILPATAKKALNHLKGQLWLERTNWYLAGGTALALQVGHRTSQDLDFFNPRKFSPQSLVKKFSSDDLKTTILREGTIYGSLLGAKISFIFYPFFLPKEPLLSYGSVRVLHERDIAVMKIVAISQRGTKRDFVDLYWYCQNREPLLDVVRRLEGQYPRIAHNYHHILKSLTYFADADADPIPKLHFRVTWKEIKNYFQTQIPQITRELLKLE